MLSSNVSTQMLKLTHKYPKKDTRMKNQHKLRSVILHQSIEAVSFFGPLSEEISQEEFGQEKSLSEKSKPVEK